MQWKMFCGIGKFYLSLKTSKVLHSCVPGSHCLLMQIWVGWFLGYTGVLLDFHLDILQYLAGVPLKMLR